MLPPKLDARTWLGKTLSEKQELLGSTPFLDLKFLDIVRAPGNWGVFASAGQNFRYAIFGRDSIETALDVCELDQDLARTIILGMARLQGVKFNSRSEEEPGKIHHEYRARNFGNIVVNFLSRLRLFVLRGRWGRADSGTLLYYGAYDTTPQYIRLVERYCRLYGDTLLNQIYMDRTGTIRNIRNSVVVAADWLVGKLMQREDHLLQYHRLNPRGLENQSWKDSHTAYMFSDGSLPDFSDGIVSVELQGYAYDALQYAATLEPSRAKEFKSLARDIQKHTLEKLWMPDVGFLAQGLATDHHGKERIIDTLTSNAAQLLGSRLLADLPADESHKYVKGLADMIMSREFLTDVGVRCRALRHVGLLDYPDYHGAYTSWPKDTFDVAEGLRAFGYQNEADQLYAQLVQAVHKSGEFYEFYYVDPDGRVWYDAAEAMTHFAEALGDNKNLPKPEPGQAWTIAAVIASSHQLISRTRQLG